MFAQALDPADDTQLGRDVRDGLMRTDQKQLPSTYLYDELGSALFDAITLLPEYGLTRADARLLKRHSGAIAEALPGPIVVAELGSGSGSKTRWILEALAMRRPLRYYPIDISAAALERCCAVLETIPKVRISSLEKSYLEGLREAAAARGRGERLLVLFLGSTIGNFDIHAAAAFLGEIRSILRRGDALLLGADLIKPVPQMLRAYDDPIGVTAAFNRNLLSRINRELDADFILDRFAHEARYNEPLARIEMHLRSKTSQKVEIGALGLSVTIRAGETIWTEASHKFRPRQLLTLAPGFRCVAQWIDEEWPFAESLLTAD